jgi:hypothetical protein
MVCNPNYLGDGDWEDYFNASPGKKIMKTSSQQAGYGGGMLVIPGMYVGGTGKKTV